VSIVTHAFNIINNINNNMQRVVKPKKLDDLTPEEIADIKDYSSSTEKPKHFKNVKELIKDLENY
jgi:uncharacterized membrane protein